MGGDPLAIKLQDVRLKLGGRDVLRGITLDVPYGDSLGVIGPNGAGKTTLYRMIMGLGLPDSGVVEVLGHRMPDPRPRGRIGYMPQDEALYPDLTVRENLNFFGQVFGMDGRRRRRRIDEVLALVDLPDRADDRVRELSGGMRRRASLAVAILHEPDLVILDEPTVGVDPELRAAFWDYFLKMNSQGTTIIVSTHHLDEASRCSRVALLRYGEVLACESASALLARTGAPDVESAFLQLARRRA